MRISLAMTTYNGEDYLEEQLESFLRQTRIPNELIVCDDGSRDSTLNILEAFQLKAPFPVTINRNVEKLGYTKNFEKALSKCSGDLIFLSDQDDIWGPNKVAVIEELFLQSPGIMLAIHDARIVDQNLAWCGATKLGQVIAATGSSTTFVTGALTIFRAELFSYVLPIPEGIVGHDIWIHKIAELLDTRVVVNQQLQLVRRHGSNASDWIASSVKIIDKVDMLKSAFVSAAANNYQQEILINESCQERLSSNPHARSMMTPVELKNILSELAKVHSALTYRDALPGSTYLRRKVMALVMLFRGEYRHFNGFKSFLRDVLR